MTNNVSPSNGSVNNGIHHDVPNSNSSLPPSPSNHNDRRSFVVGSYLHNIELLQSTSEDVDEDRLIREAAKQMTSRQPSRSANQNNIAISPSELRNNSGTIADEGNNSRPSIGTVGRNIFRVFERSDSYSEVTREEIQRVRVIHNRVHEGSIFSFNYNALLLISSIIAALGLGSNSSAIIIASMLVSPLMGPVTGMAYGATIEDFKMFRTALVTETVSLCVCIVFGALVGLSMVPFEVSDNWPTDEQQSRAMLTNLYVGMPVAFFSGLGGTYV